MSRPKQYEAKGGRQAMWTALRRGGELTLGTLAAASGSEASSVRVYMHALQVAGYLAHEGDIYRLINDTGARAPSASTARGATVVYDWNLNPPMRGSELRHIWQDTALSLSAFGAALGLGGNAATRLRQMMDGQRPISPAVETAALAEAWSKRPRKRRAGRDAPVSCRRTR